MHEREGKSSELGGYFITDEIRERLLQNPDHVVEDKVTGRIISVLFGRQRIAEDPQFSVFCRIVNPDGSLTEIGAGGRTRDDALRAAGLNVYRLVKAAEQIIQDNEKKGE